MAYQALASLLFAAAVSSPLPGATNHTDRLRLRDARPSEVASIVGEIASLPDIRARVVAASERFLGVRYQLDALGEGPGEKPDEDPRLRWDAVDCQTFVETVIALARVKTAEEVLPTLDAIRYDGPPRYERRNHFFEAQWIPTNTRKGYVRDATLAIAGKSAIQHVKIITAASWKARTLAQTMALPDDRTPIGRFPVAYLPLGKVLAHAKAIPSGTLFAVVREDRPKTPTMVTHVGIVVQGPGGTFLRHAGRDLYEQVVDEEIAHFIARNASYTSWPVLGLTFLEAVNGR